jgi:hypothetical protein
VSIHFVECLLTLRRVTCSRSKAPAVVHSCAMSGAVEGQSRTLDQYGRLDRDGTPNSIPDSLEHCQTAGSREEIKPRIANAKGPRARSLKKKVTRKVSGLFHRRTGSKRTRESILLDVLPIDLPPYPGLYEMFDGPMDTPELANTEVIGYNYPRPRVISRCTSELSADSELSTSSISPGAWGDNEAAELQADPCRPHESIDRKTTHSPPFVVESSDYSSSLSLRSPVENNIVGDRYLNHECTSNKVPLSQNSVSNPLQSSEIWYPSSGLDSGTFSPISPLASSERSPTGEHDASQMGDISVLPTPPALWPASTVDVVTSPLAQAYPTQVPLAAQLQDSGVPERSAPAIINGLTEGEVCKARRCQYNIHQSLVEAADEVLTYLPPFVDSSIAFPFATTAVMLEMGVIALQRLINGGKLGNLKSITAFFVLTCSVLKVMHTPQELSAYVEQVCEDVEALVYGLEHPDETGMVLNWIANWKHSLPTDHTKQNSSGSSRWPGVRLLLGCEGWRYVETFPSLAGRAKSHQLCLSLNTGALEYIGAAAHPTIEALVEGQKSLVFTGTAIRLCLRYLLGQFFFCISWITY